MPLLSEYAKVFYVWDRCDWLKRQAAKGKTISRDTANAKRAYMVNHILPEFGHLKLDAINPVRFENWLIGLSLANQTKNHIFYTFRTILKEARREGLLERNPLDDVEQLAVQHNPTGVFVMGENSRCFSLPARAS